MKLLVVATTEDGVLWHTIRHPKNQWDRFGDAKSQTGTTPDPGKALDSTSARDSKNNLHVLFVTPDGKLWHTIRSGTTRLWTKLGDVAGRVPGGIQPHETEPHGIGIIKAVAAATDRLDLHVLAVTTEDKLWCIYSGRSRSKASGGRRGEYVKLCVHRARAVRASDEVTGATNEGLGLHSRPWRHADP